jgi:predicted nucleic acid-binding protein
MPGHGLRSRDERGYSFVDATSFSLTRHLRIHAAFSFEGDFAAAGSSSYGRKTSRAPA